MKEIVPYIIPTLGLLLNLTIFIVGRLDKKAERKEKRLKEAQAQMERGESFPARKSTHL
ncbi:hypothetical protein [Paenibacillus odorifer]|uniref:hypothetical protein n=1 Tax=Paenibacillus odorifer TaxID=189426 RepID=UPI0015C4057F|nr:hypothetical protein [Paenibacillus odorifer]